MQVMSILSIQFLHSNATKFFLLLEKRKNFEIASYNSQVVASAVSAMPMIYVVKPESSNSNARKRREWSGVLNRPIHYRQNGGTSRRKKSGSGAGTGIRTPTSVTTEPKSAAYPNSAIPALDAVRELEPGGNELKIHFSCQLR